MEKKAKLVFGVGIKGEKHPSYEGAKPLREYTTWVNMLRRCTEKLWSKHPTYTGTTCSESFKDYDYFMSGVKTKLALATQMMTIYLGI